MLMHDLFAYNLEWSEFCICPKSVQRIFWRERPRIRNIRFLCYHAVNTAVTQGTIHLPPLCVLHRQPTPPFNFTLHTW